MRMFDWLVSTDPTVKELCSYLDVVIEELLKKHGKLSHPDFDTELQEITGIGWKQVKNYKNHPKQNQTIADNSKVLEFCLTSRKKNKRFFILAMAKKYAIVAAGLVLVSLLAAYVFRPDAVVFIAPPVETYDGTEVDKSKFAKVLFKYSPTFSMHIKAGLIGEVSPKPRDCRRIAKTTSCLFTDSNDGIERQVAYTSTGDYLYKFSVTINNYKGVDDYALSDDELKDMGLRLISENDVSGLSTSEFESDVEKVTIRRSFFGEGNKQNFISIEFQFK